MKKRAGNTKDRILEIALDLFSKRGFSAVSIRDISSTVGIKESTIYYYFTNKQDIFDTLLQTVVEMINDIKSKFNEQFEINEKVEKTAFIGVGCSVLFGFYLDQNVLRFFRMLTIEQNINEKAACVYKYIFIDIPLQQNTEVFQKMMDKGHFRQDDARCLATEYYGIIYFVFHKYFSSNNADAEVKVKAEMELTTLLDRFFDRYNK